MNERSEILSQKKLLSNGEIVDYLKQFGEEMEVAIDLAFRGISPWFWRLAALFGGPSICAAVLRLSSHTS